MSDSIDEQIRQELDARKAKNKGRKQIKVLLLGQSESGKSTTLKRLFALPHNPSFSNFLVQNSSSLIPPMHFVTNVSHGVLSYTSISSVPYVASSRPFLPASTPPIPALFPTRQTTRTFPRKPETGLIPRPNHMHAVPLSSRTRHRPRLFSPLRPMSTSKLALSLFSHSRTDSSSNSRAEMMTSPRSLPGLVPPLSPARPRMPPVTVKLRYPSAPDTIGKGR